jgi:hypothetical protein
MTETSHWEEAYQRLHSIDCAICQCCSTPFIANDLLKYPLRVPLHGLLHLHTCRGLRGPLTGCHHDQRLSYGRVSLGVVVGRRDGWSYGVCKVGGLTWLIQRRMLAWETRPERPVVAHRTRLRWYLWASKGESWFQLKGFGDVCGKRLAEVVHLLLHFRHRPYRSTLLQDAHVSDKEFPGVVIEIGVGASNCNLFGSAGLSRIGSRVLTR